MRKKGSQTHSSVLSFIGDGGAIPLEMGKFYIAQPICAADVLFRSFCVAVHLFDGVRSFFCWFDVVLLNIQSRSAGR
jgi:hypothetical protein